MTDASSRTSESRNQIRGSFVLLTGRVASLLLNLVTQVLVVRYLFQADYGAFAFALSAVELVGYLSTLGLNKACSRFLPIYQEKHEHERALGTLVVSIAVVLGVSITMVLGLVAGQEWLSKYLVSSQLSLTLLLTLVALAPIESLDFMLESFFTAFGKVRIVFFRQHILRPGLKLAAVLGVVATEASVQTLAYCYLIAGGVGFIYYVPCLIGVLRQQNLIDRSRVRQIQFPFQELWGFSGPLLTSHFAFLCQGSVAIVFLEFLSGNIAVGEFRAVLPFARLNLVVVTCFSLLFTPLASRYLSRRMESQMENLYWDSVAWITVLTFPILALSTVFAKPLTILMLGTEYSSASGPMALLAVGFFFEAALGLSVHALRVYARVRYVVMADLLATVAAVILMFILIPRYGTWGAAAATAAFIVVGNVCYMGFAHFTTDVKTLSSRGLRIYSSTLLVLLGLQGLQQLVQPHWTGVAPLVGLAWLGLVFANRHNLAVERVCPEITRVPILSRIFAAERTMSLKETTEAA